MLGVKPYISFKGNCKEAIEFYKEKLGAEVLFSGTYGESPMADMAPDDPDAIMPMQETFWAERFGMLTDKFGINWMFNCDKPHDEQAKATA